VPTPAVYARHADFTGPVVRIDLHCHSAASTEADEAALNAIGCPECYSEPEQVYAQARSRGMDFVTITDHDALGGVSRLVAAGKPGVLVGEEFTCYFPEDGCKMHVLVWGLSPADHGELQRHAKDVYACARIIEERNLAHAVAHPVYRQNDKLERWHLERLLLMFKGFECLNGAHSILHRESFEPVLDELTPAKLGEYAARHDMAPRWPEPHVKARTGGSDDHGLFNVGLTWTEFPPDVRTTDDLLDCLRTARCRPGGEAGSSLKLAHNFYSVGLKYYTRQADAKPAKPSVTNLMLSRLVGERPRVRRRAIVAMAVGHKARGLARRIARPFRRAPEPTGTALLGQLLSAAFAKHLGASDALRAALASGRAPLGEHAAMFDLVGNVNRDVARGLFDAVAKAVGRGQVAPIFDALGSVAAHQFLLLPYYFALFHQNRERHLLRPITGHGRRADGSNLRVAVFTDTFDEINGVSRFVRDMAAQAHADGHALTVHTCVDRPTADVPFRKNFAPLLSRPLPGYKDLPLSVPPLAEVLEWADRQQFDAVHVDTPGPMGLCGVAVAKMLHVPLLATYHTDFPAYVHSFTADHRLTTATAGYMKWFYGRPDVVFSRSRKYEVDLRAMGVADARLAHTPPGIDTEKFNPQHRDERTWQRLGVGERFKLVFVGRVSVEKNLPLLAEAFARLCRRRSDVALVVAGDGPYAGKMKAALAGLPAYFLGFQNDAQLAPLYTGGDLFVFPSRTDTLGQVVVEAQAAGLPVLVSNDGGPKEVMDDGITGLVLPATDAGVWVDAIDRLLDDEPRRLRMARSAPTRMARYSLAHTFAAFWAEHIKAVAAREPSSPESVQPDSIPVMVPAPAATA